MRLVLDSCVAIKWLLTEDQSDKANALRDDFGKGLYELLAPDVFPIEAAHALTRAERRNIIPHGQAEVLLADLLTTPPQLLRSLPLLARATELASQARIGVYDCLYVALAEREGCEVISTDVRLKNSFPNNVVELSAL